MKTKFLVLLFLFPLLSIAQSKFSLNASAGALSIKEDIGENFELGVAYKVSNHIAINLNGMHAGMENDDLNLDYNFKKIALTAEYFFASEGSFGLSSNMGFSYVHFDKDLPLDKNDGLGVELGVKTSFNVDKKFDYGFILNSTFSSISPGGILQGNLFFKYNI